MSIKHFKSIIAYISSNGSHTTDSDLTNIISSVMVVVILVVALVCISYNFCLIIEINSAHMISPIRINLRMRKNLELQFTSL